MIWLAMLYIGGALWVLLQILFDCAGSDWDDLMDRAGATGLEDELGSGLTACLVIILGVVAITWMAAWWPYYLVKQLKRKARGV